MKELIAIQAKLNAPKERRNDFGKYNYRSAEDILKAVKPLLNENGCVLLLSDEIYEFGGRFYVEATATLMNAQGEKLSVKGFAREEETKKGMDASQITGTASSYARKYALNGLFAIDDGVDADRLNTSPSYTERKPKVQASEGRKQEVALDIAVAEMSSVKSRAEMNAVWAKYPQFKEDTQFRNACIEAGKKYPQQ